MNFKSRVKEIREIQWVISKAHYDMWEATSNLRDDILNKAEKENLTENIMEELEYLSMQIDKQEHKATESSMDAFARLGVYINGIQGAYEDDPKNPYRHKFD